jgi:hypothetical protein
MHGILEFRTKRSSIGSDLLMHLLAHQTRKAARAIRATLAAVLSQDSRAAEAEKAWKELDAFLRQQARAVRALRACMTAMVAIILHSSSRFFFSLLHCNKYFSGAR